MHTSTLIYITSTLALKLHTPWCLSTTSKSSFLSSRCPNLMVECALLRDSYSLANVKVPGIHVPKDFLCCSSFCFLVHRIINVDLRTSSSTLHVLKQSRNRQIIVQVLLELTKDLIHFYKKKIFLIILFILNFFLIYL